MSRSVVHGSAVALAAMGALAMAVALVIFMSKGLPQVPKFSEIMKHPETEEVAAVRPEPELLGVTTEVDEETSVYMNDLLGLSFSYPSRYTIREQKALDGDFEQGDLYQGDLIAVHVLDEGNHTVFSAMSTSENFAQDATEGCCYYYLGGLDMTQSAAELEQALDAQLDQVFRTESLAIDGKPTASFAYTTTYVAHGEFVGAITPNIGTVYPNVFFSSGLLREVPYDEAVIYPFTGIDEDRKAEFEHILSTVDWLND